MTKSELIDRIAQRLPSLPEKDVELAIKTILNKMAATLSEGELVKYVPDRTIKESSYS